MVAGALQEEQACIRDSCINQQVEREFRYSFTKECVSCSDPMRMIMDVYSNETVPPSPPLFSCRLMEIHCETMKRHKRNSSSGDVWILYEKKKAKIIWTPTWGFLLASWVHQGLSGCVFVLFSNHSSSNRNSVVTRHLRKVSIMKRYLNSKMASRRKQRGKNHTRRRN